MRNEGYFASLPSDGETDDAPNGLQDLEDRTVYLRNRLNDVVAELERHKADSKIQMQQMAANVWDHKKELESVKKDSKKQIDELQVKIRRLEKENQGEPEIGSASEYPPVTVKRNRSRSPSEKALQGTKHNISLQLATALESTWTCQLCGRVCKKEHRERHEAMHKDCVEEFAIPGAANRDTGTNFSSQSNSEGFTVLRQELQPGRTMGDTGRAMAMSKLKKQMTRTQTRLNSTIVTAKNNTTELLRLLTRSSLWSIAKEDIEQELDFAAPNKEQLLYTLLDIQSLLESSAHGRSLIPDKATIFGDIRKAAAKRIGNSGLPSWHLSSDAVQVLQRYRILLQDEKIKKGSG
jgi:hypothetical protein